MSGRRTLNRSISDHPAAAAAARALPGQWIWAGTYPSSLGAKSAAASVRNARFSVYEGGGFDAYAAPAGDEDAVWVRYTRDVADLVPLPDRMTVIVLDRGDGTHGYSGANPVTITIRTTCAKCGGPRGWDAVRRRRNPYDGDWITSDEWTNPCGHVDMYEAVLRESRLRPLRAVPAERTTARPVLDPATASDPVALILTEMTTSDCTSAQQAEYLLADRGHAEAAVALRAEINARSGHMSARQAAEFLHDLSEPVPAVDLTPQGVAQ